MTTAIQIQNRITLYLEITKNYDNSHSYRYLSLMDNGAVVNLEGLVISQPTIITVQLTDVTKASYVITQCLIPCDQKTVTANIRDINSSQLVTLTDKDNETGPKSYNFVIIAKDKQTGEQIVCDPQARNKGKNN